MTLDEAIKVAEARKLPQYAADLRALKAAREAMLATNVGDDQRRGQFFCVNCSAYLDNDSLRGEHVSGCEIGQALAQIDALYPEEAGSDDK